MLLLSSFQFFEFMKIMGLCFNLNRIVAYTGAGGISIIEIRGSERKKKIGRT